MCPLTGFRYLYLHVINPRVVAADVQVRCVGENGTGAVGRRGPAVIVLRIAEYKGMELVHIVKACDRMSLVRIYVVSHAVSSGGGFGSMWSTQASGIKLSYVSMETWEQTPFETYFA